MKASRWKRWGPLVALIVAGGLRWVVVDTHPEAGSTAASMALGCAWAAAIMYLLPQRGPRVDRGSAWSAMLAGAMLLGGPLLVLLVPTPVEGGGLTMALALTAVVVAVAAAATGQGANEDVAGRLWPGLAAVAGLLLIVPSPSLSSLPADAVMALAPLLAGVGAVWFCVQPGSMAWRMRWALTGAVLLFAAGTALGWTLRGRPTVAASAVAWDGVLAGLGVLTLARLGPVRWSAQFTLLPLVVLVVSIVLMQPPMSWRIVAGLLLVAGASGYLLWAESSEQVVVSKE